MAIYHRGIRQYSKEYDALKLGIPTSSNFHRIITPEKGLRAKGWKDYGRVLIAERLLGYRLETYSSPFMDDGLEQEPFAADWYEWIMTETGQLAGPIQEIGFITNDAKTVGCTPDRLVGDVGLVEFKCAQPPGQVGYLLDGVDRAHWPQLQGHLHVVDDREWDDIVAYHKVLDRDVNRVYRDEPYIKRIEEELDNLNTYILDGIEKIEAKRRGLPPPPDLSKRKAKEPVSETLKAQLKASLAAEESKAPTLSVAVPVQQPLSTGAGRSSSREDAGIATELQPGNPETRVQIPPGSTPSEPAQPSGQGAAGGGGIAEELSPPPGPLLIKWSGDRDYMDWSEPADSGSIVLEPLPPTQPELKAALEAIARPGFGQTAPAGSPQDPRTEPAAGEAGSFPPASPSLWETMTNYRPAINDADINGEGCDQLIALAKLAPSDAAIVAFRNANLDRMDRMRLDARQRFVRAMAARKEELKG